MNKIFIGKQKETDFNKIIENINKKQKEIIEKLQNRFNKFDSEKKKYNLKMLAILYTTYLSTLGSIDQNDFKEEDLLFIKSLTDSGDNNNFNVVINTFQNLNKPNNNIQNQDLYEANLLKMEKKKSDLKLNSQNSDINKENIKMDSCIFCTEDFEENGIINPQLDCKKYVHGKCFIDYITNELNNNHFPIRCPLCLNDDKHEINFKIILDCLLLNDKDDLAVKLENISLNHLAESNIDVVTFCPTPGCNYMCFYDKNEFHLNCPLCKRSYCLQCKTEWHKDKTCEEYQLEKKDKDNDIKFEEYAKGSNFKQCPNCKRWVEKISGCNHITCPCGSHFCYSCGGLMDNNLFHSCTNRNYNNLFGNNNRTINLFNNNPLNLFGNNYLNNNNNYIFGVNQNNYINYQNNNNQGLFGNIDRNNQIKFGFVNDKNNYNDNNNASLFGNNNNNNNNISLFGNNNNNISLFGNNNNSNKISFFRNNNKTNNISLFGNNNNSNNTSLFGNNNNINNASLFGNNNNNSNNISLFGNNNNTNNTSLFGNNNNTNNTSLFGNNNNNIF